MKNLNYPLPWRSGSDDLRTIENRLTKEKRKVHNLYVLSARRNLPVESTSSNLHVGEGKKAQASEWGCQCIGDEGTAKKEGAGAQGQDAGISNPLTIQNTEWLQAIGKRFSNYLINC